MNERQEERLSPLPEIGEGLGEWSEALLARRVGWSVKSFLTKVEVIGKSFRRIRMMSI